MLHFRMPIDKVKNLFFHEAQQHCITFPKLISVHLFEVFASVFVGWKSRPETQEDIASCKNTLARGNRLLTHD